MIEPKHLIAAALHSSGGAMSLDQMLALFYQGDMTKDTLRKHISEIAADLESGPLALTEVASGYRIQIKAEYANSLQVLADKKPPKYTRSLLETLALILYRQPITRGEIEDVRGVAVSTHTIKTLLDRRWVKVIGHKEVPGKPALYGSTKTVLDYFGLKDLSDLPPLDELVNLEEIGSKLNEQLSLNVDGELPASEGLSDEFVTEEAEEAEKIADETQEKASSKLSGMDAIDAALLAIQDMDDVEIDDGSTENEVTSSDEVVALTEE